MARRNGNGQIRIEDVAQRAGVAPITVSRALRTPDKVSPDTRRRIQDAVKASGYVPNLVAGSLASNRTRVVAALVPNIGNPLFALTLRGLADMLRQNGFQLMVGSSDHSADEEETLVRTILGQRPCGLVLHETIHNPSARDLLLRAGIPIVEIGDLVETPMDSVVSFSSRDAARAAVDHLTRRGYRRIGLVTSLKSARSDARRAGFDAGLRAAGLPVEPWRRLEAVSDVGGGIDAITTLMDRAPDTDAVLFTGNAAAVGALLACQRRGWAVPGRIAIATFDETDLTREMRPSLTSVRIPRYDIGRRAAEALIDEVLTGAGGGLRVDMGFEVLHRETT